jgi:PTH1 family peptidyl-tRNA hydrolase
MIKRNDSDLAKVLTIIHDDLDINLGKYKETDDSRSAGHNGVQSIIDHLKTQKFKRIRIGVRTDMLQNIPANKFVLQKFKEEELKTINQIIKELKID